MFKAIGNIMRAVIPFAEDEKYIVVPSPAGKVDERGYFRAQIINAFKRGNSLVITPFERNEERQLWWEVVADMENAAIFREGEHLIVRKIKE